MGTQGWVPDPLGHLGGHPGLGAGPSRAPGCNPGAPDFLNVEIILKSQDKIDYKINKIFMVTLHLTPKRPPYRPTTHLCGFRKYP